MSVISNHMAKSPLRMHAFEALDDFSQHVNQFDVPHVSMFQDDSAPQICWTAPVKWDLKPIYESHCRHFLNYPINGEATSKSNRGHQPSGDVNPRPETPLLMTRDVVIHMTGDGNALNAGPSISPSLTAPTTSPSAKASITMTPSSGSTLNVDGKVDKLDSQNNVNIVM
ncbi:hypothetical protein IW262DRAFT_1468222 [Armillaria fumosa]|nr:hypothetical protein IW262DRAFT_1468222 [Armillaria fumosa]